MLALVMALSVAAEVDRAPSGTVVTVRPEPGEMAAVVDDQGKDVITGLDGREHLWLVHERSWRQAVAAGEERNGLRQLADDRLEDLQACTIDLEATRTDLSVRTAAHDRAMGQAEALKRQRTGLVIGAAGAGVVVGVLGATALAFAL